MQKFSGGKNFSFPALPDCYRESLLITISPNKCQMRVLTCCWRALARQCIKCNDNTKLFRMKDRRLHNTHGIWSTSFRLVFTWLTERTYVLVYRLYGWGRGNYQKKGRSVSGVSHLLHWTFTIWSIDSCQNKIATDQYHMTISRAHVSTHRGDVIYLKAVRWPVNCFTRSRLMLNLILSS